MNRGTASTVSHDRHQLRITAKCFDITLYPAQRQSLILQSKVSTGRVIAGRKKSKSSQPVRDRHQYYGLIHQQFCSGNQWRVVSGKETTAMNVHECRKSCRRSVLRSFSFERSVHVKIQTILLSLDSTIG
uniref:Uncharacterized protein n=1 Tax=Anopheles culicifacies TaxID=139723 RepID=A0A182LSS7_9DIPT